MNCGDKLDELKKYQQKFPVESAQWNDYERNMLLIECEIFNMYISNIKSEEDMKNIFSVLFSLACHLIVRKESKKYEKELCTLSLKSQFMLDEFKNIINKTKEGNI